MPSTGIGVYLGSASLVENDEISSTYEGRHLTFLEGDITGHEHTWVTKGHPVVVGEFIVGVAFKTGTAATDLIAIDTEGIWALSVVASDEEGDNAVVAGDELFIHRTTAIISKNQNKATHTHFGYALGNIDGGSTFVIAVKVHWDPADEDELVGTRAAPSISADASHSFRKYCYEAQGGTEQVGTWTEVTLTTVASFWAAAGFMRLAWTADANWVTGYSAVLELELAIATGAGSMDTCTILQLNSMIGALTGTGHTNFRLSWFRLHDYAATDNEQINILFEIIDQAGLYPAANDATNLFVASSGDVAVTHTLMIMVNGVKYWILCANSN